MSRLLASDRGALAFAEQLLTLLREGSFTATYKYAVILALMDLCLEHSTRKGMAPNSVTTSQLAEKVVELYWPHAREFRGKLVLRQNAGSQAAIVRLISRFREDSPAEAGASLIRSKLADPAGWGRLLRDVEWKLVEMPLPKLQRLGAETVPFIYQITWSDDIRKSEFNSPDFDNLIRLVPGSGDHLVRLAGLLRPLVCREWAALVAHLNQDVIDDPELDQFLFGVDRSSLRPVTSPLRELQDDRCFYCHDPLSAKAQVDHFVPWSRYPDNGLDNLVLAHPRCNRDKRDHLAATVHVSHWVERGKRRSTDLAAIAAKVSWPRAAARTVSVARSIYLRLPQEARLWQIEDEFVPARRDELASLLVTAGWGA